MEWVIGDVHGYFKTLAALIARLPEGSRPIFVGDLIDRGRDSAEVVRLVREKGYACVLGNHEAMMCTFGPLAAAAIEAGYDPDLDNVWCANGGIDTLRSYGIVAIRDGKPVAAPGCAEALERFRSDIAWMRQLPLYLETGVVREGRKVVVSHANVADAWTMRRSGEMAETFMKIATTNRRTPDPDAPIFNVFGHTPRREGVEATPWYANVDTGCYMRSDIDVHGYGRLSAFCIRNGEVISVPCKE